MSNIRTITDPQELVIAQLDAIREGNARMRETIKSNRAALKGGLAEEARLESELASFATAVAAKKGKLE